MLMVLRQACSAISQSVRQIGVTSPSFARKAIFAIARYFAV
jgi:hypothetical protein